jgi:hypothetical protein
MLAVTAGPKVAAAQTPKQIAAARQAFKQAEEAESKGDLTTAAAKFREALAIKDTPQIRLRLGAVEEKLGHLVAALAAYQEGLDKASGIPAVSQVATEQIEALRPRVPLVTLVVPEPPPGLALTLDRVSVEAGKPLPVDPGQHRVHAEAPGWQPRDKAFTIAERDRTRIELRLVPDVAPAPPPPPPSRVPGTALTASGGAALVAGAVMLGVSYAKDATIDAQCHGSARLFCPIAMESQILSEVKAVNALRFTGIGLGVVGAAGVAAGIYLLARKPPSTTGSLRVLPAVGPRTAGVEVTARF